MSVECVIARYNEDLSWLKELKNKKITIYNKGKDDISYDSIKLPNIGRESHTYLTHIIQNYNNLADITIFTQGNPFTHSPDFIELVKDPSLFEPIQPLTAYYSPPFENARDINKKYILEKKLYLDGFPPKIVLNKSKEVWIKNHKIYVEYYNKDGVALYPKYYRDFYILNFFKYIYIKIFKFDSILKFMKDRYKLTNIKLNTMVPMCYGAIFSVSKEVILQRKKGFYENILNILIEDHNKYNIDTGLLLERLWLSIFNYQKNNKHYIELASKDYKIEFNELIVNNNKINLNIITPLQVYFLLYIDDQEYILIIGFYGIFLRKNRSSFKKHLPDIKILKENQTNNIKIILHDKLKVIVNNKVYMNYYIKEKVLKKIKIDMSYNEIKIN